MYTNHILIENENENTLCYQIIVIKERTKWWRIIT